VLKRRGGNEERRKKEKTQNRLKNAGTNDFTAQRSTDESVCHLSLF
jgi:CelD/BcsL family acetyltransferase involved in cellulose biosynthesis